HIVLPLHYPLTNDDALLREIRRQQLLACQETGLDSSIAGLARHESYGTIFDVIHLEGSIRDRYFKRQPTPGFVTVLEVAIAVALGTTVPYVQKLRKTISAIGRGGRKQVKWLQRANRE